jgi:phosphoribosylformylglycinamidine synthase
MRAIDSDSVRACHDLSEGGLGVAAAEMAFSGDYGIELELRKVPTEAIERNDFVLFSESNSRFLLEVVDEDKRDLQALMKGKTYARIGTVTKSPRLRVLGLDGKLVLDASISDLRASWKQTLEEA